MSGGKRSGIAPPDDYKCYEYPAASGSAVLGRPL